MLGALGVILAAVVLVKAVAVVVAAATGEE